MNDIRKYIEHRQTLDNLPSIFLNEDEKKAQKEFGRLDGNINTWCDPYDIGFSTTWARQVHFEKGVTVLVGCNGIGKTTLIENIKAECRKKNVPCISFDNLRDGGSSQFQPLLSLGMFDRLGAIALSSEGERISQNIGLFASVLGNKLHNEYATASEVWLLFDAVDSGFSVDNVIELKEGLFDTILDDMKNKDIYIIVSANAYEMARGEKCFNVERGRYIEFADYEEYRSFIIKTREKKDKRYADKT